MAELPDDLARWPSDPYALLGVKPGTPARDIRKAYAALIRRFKPERTPEHFQRLREAFDQVQRDEQWRAFLPPAAQASETPAEPLTTTFNSAPPAPQPQTAADHENDPRADGMASPPDPEGDADWDDACTGGHERVYRQLCERVLRGGAPESAYLQLYWLRVAFPEVDPDIRPIDWALRAIGAGFEQGRAFEAIHAELLYRHELCRDPAFAQLLDRVRDAHAVVRLYDMRWRAALGVGQWNMVLDDLPNVRARLFDQSSMMANILSMLMGWMAWSSEEHVRRAYDECERELESLAGGNRMHDYLMERIDFLGELADQWRQFPKKGHLHEELRSLVPISWTGTAGQIRWSVYRLYKSIVENARRALDALDSMTIGKPLLGAQVTQTAQQTYFASRGAYRPEREDVRTALGDFLRRSGDAPHRMDFLDFLVREGLTVDDVLGNVDFREATTKTQNFLAQVSADNPVRLINLAQITLAG